MYRLVMEETWIILKVGFPRFRPDLASARSTRVHVQTGLVARHCSRAPALRRA